MNPSRAQLASLIHSIQGVCDEIDQICRESRGLGGEGEAVIQHGARALEQLYEMRAEIYDLDPDFALLQQDLAFDSDLDLSHAIESLTSDLELVRKGALGALGRHLPPSVYGRLESTESWSVRRSLATEWWSKQARPFVPIQSLYRDLRHPRIFMRYRACKAIDDLYGSDFWCAKSSDVDLEGADEWFHGLQDDPRATGLT